MHNKFLTWYNTNYTPITWFIIGVLANNILYHLARDQLGLALTDAVLAGINYYLWKSNDV